LEEHMVDLTIIDLLLQHQGDIHHQDANLQTPIQLFKQNSQCAKVAKLLAEQFKTTFALKNEELEFNDMDIIPFAEASEFKDIISGMQIDASVKASLDDYMVWFTTHVAYNSMDLKTLWGLAVGSKTKGGWVNKILEDMLKQITTSEHNPSEHNPSEHNPSEHNSELLLHVNNIRKTAGSVYFFKESPLQLETQFQATQTTIAKNHPQSLDTFISTTKQEMKDFLEEYYWAVKQNIYRRLYLIKQQQKQQEFNQEVSLDSSEVQVEPLEKNVDLLEQQMLLHQLVESQQQDLQEYHQMQKNKHQQRLNQIKDHGARKIPSSDSLPPWNTNFNL